MLSMWSLPGYGLCKNKNEKYGKFTCVNTTRLLSSRKFQLKPRKTYCLNPTRLSSLRKFEQKQVKHDIQTLPGYPLCENFKKTGFLVVCSLFCLTDMMKFSIESLFPCYYGIRNESSKVLIYTIMHCHSQSRSYIERNTYYTYSIDSFLSHLSFFEHYFKV